ncbi:MAG: tRNA dihydrouridine synthase DusB [Deltaproteobacteria bacterium]|nr:MAG: tRNA dihydrouridine synthase DusB [Deltaproteobacteria bacterium]
MSLVIRDIAIEPNLVLAPMEGVTDVIFRRLVRRIGGCGLTVTEFIAAEGLKRNVKKVLEMAEFDPDESPLSIQIYGRTPASMAEGAKIVQDLGADIVDLNMGCPSKKVCAHSGGSALMKEPELARDIVRAMRAAVDIPFTVKMRSGWDHDHKNAPEIAYMCQEEGAEMVAVHWRTRTDKYGGVRELDTLRAVVDKLSIPVVANGDIVDAASALDTMAQTGAAGLMIGRGAIRNPWVFREIEAAMKGEPIPEIDFLERKRVLLGYLEDIRDRFHSEKGTLGRFKKISGYFTKGVPYGSELRQGIFHSQEIGEAIDVVESFFDGLPDRLGPRHAPFVPETFKADSFQPQVAK